VKDGLRIYYYFLLGALGGLNGWLCASLLYRSGVETPTLSQQAGYGAILGAAIGLALAVYDGVLARSFKRFVKYGATGMLSGCAAGAMALPLAQAAYQGLLGVVFEETGFALTPFLVGTVCWVLLGGVIGLGETLHKGTQQWKGLVGGVLGGLFGGGLHEALRWYSHGANGVAAQLLLAISLTALGGAIGAAVALIIVALRGAWVEALDGKLAGRSFDLTKFVVQSAANGLQGLIGSDEWKCHVCLPGDGTLLPRHAQIGLVNGVPFLTVLPEAAKTGVTLLNGEQVSAAPLSDGDRLKIGATNLIYREKRRRRRRANA
jgi:hypothetical protein